MVKKLLGDNKKPQEIDIDILIYGRVEIINDVYKDILPFEIKKTWLSKK